MLAFPGRIAGASLKPLTLPEYYVEDVPAFPGRIAGASLKQAAEGARVDHVRMLSPAESPGPH